MINYIKYFFIILKAKINKTIQMKYIYIPNEQKSVVIRSFSELYLSEFFEEIFLVINKEIANQKELLMKIIKLLVRKNKKLYLEEDVKVFNDDDIKYLFSLNKNIIINERYIDKSKSLAGNQILAVDLSSYILILEKLDFFEKICEKYCKSDFEKIIFTMVELADYVRYGDSKTRNTSCLANVFLLKFGVCIDFSIALWKCLERLNIESLIIKGIGNSKDTSINAAILYNHAWNQVKLNGKWYNVDVTWFNTMENTQYLLAEDKIFYSDNVVHQTRFEKKTCLSSINQDEIKNKISEFRKFKNIFSEFDKGNRKEELIPIE